MTATDRTEDSVKIVALNVNCAGNVIQVLVEHEGERKYLPPNQVSSGLLVAFREGR